MSHIKRDTDAVETDGEGNVWNGEQLRKGKEELAEVGPLPLSPQ